MLGRDAQRALDPAVLMADAGLTPDEWQARALRSNARRMLWLCSRQTGKSTVAAAAALHLALYEPGSLVLLLSPSQRQSSELFRKLLTMWRALDGVPDAAAESALRIEFENSSRVVSLPGSDSTVRGFSNVAMLVVDEAAYCSDSFLTAVLPSTVSNPWSRILMLTTPNLQAGMFHDLWFTDDTWEKVRLTWRECPRLTPEAVELYRRTAGELAYRREFECEFLAPDGAAFDWDMVQSAIRAEVETFDFML